MKLYTLPIGDLSANCYIVIDEESGEAVVIDPGWLTDDLKKVLTGGEINKLKYILLTHGHFDHICGVYDLHEYTNSPIAIHKSDAECLYDEEKSLAKDSVYPFKPIHADILLKDGDVLTLGKEKIKVMHTPGHTPGGVCYIFESSRLMFTGDTLFRFTVGRTDFAGGSKEQMMDSIIRLRALDGDYEVFPGHNISTTLSSERVRNLYMRRLDRQK